MNETAATCICIAMRQASRQLTSHYDAALAPAGVNIAQFSLLRKLRRHGALSLTALAELVELDRSTLGRNLRVLERLGVVELSAGRDQRESVAALTEAGRETLAKGDPLWDKAQADMADKIGTEGVAQLTALLGALQGEGA
jgi:DNA-binding MarR family transcriptional regulator